MFNLRRIATKGTALLIAALAFVIWPGCWVVVSVHHASICGWGYSGWFCDEPWLTAVWHQVLTSASPLVSFVLADVAYSRWSRG